MNLTAWTLQGNVVALATLLLSTQCFADTIQYDVRGIITAYDADFPLEVPIVVGDPWAGTLWLDFPQPGTDPYPHVFAYNEGMHGTLTIGSYSFDFNDGDVRIFDEYPAAGGPHDSLFLNWTAPLVLEEHPRFGDFYITDAFFYAAGVPLDGSLSSTLNMTSANIAVPYFSLDMSTGPIYPSRSAWAEGTADYFSAVVVPVPATGCLLLPAFGLLGMTRRRAAA